jgi:hypothetical protein
VRKNYPKFKEIPKELRDSLVETPYNNTDTEFTIRGCFHPHVDKEGPAVYFTYADGCIYLYILPHERSTIHLFFVQKGSVAWEKYMRVLPDLQTEHNYKMLFGKFVDFYGDRS